MEAFNQQGNRMTISPFGERRVIVMTQTLIIALSRF